MKKLILLLSVSLLIAATFIFVSLAAAEEVKPFQGGFKGGKEDLISKNFARNVSNTKTSKKGIIEIDLQEDRKLKFENFTLVLELEGGEVELRISHQRNHLTKIIPLNQLEQNRYFSLQIGENQRVFRIKNSQEESRKPEKMNRYIVEFKSQPSLAKKSKLERKLGISRKEDKLYRLKKLEKTHSRNERETVGVNQKISKLESEITRSRKILQKKIKRHRKRIRALHERAKTDIEDRVKGDRLKFPKQEFSQLFNGIVVSTQEERVDDIKHLPYVKEVWKDQKVKTFLNTSVPLINADDLWSEGINGKGVNISILDTGVNYSHPDLGTCTQQEFLQGDCKKVIEGYDFVNDNPNPMDNNGHGTHVASTAAGNGTLDGVAPGANLMAYKVLDSSGSGYTSWIIDGIERAVNDSADVISMSLGGTGNPDDPLSKAVDTAVENGAVAVVAAGNSGPDYQTIGSPGTARKAITVGATYEKGYQSFEWNCEPGVNTPCGECPDDGTVSCDYWNDAPTQTDQIVSFSSRGPVIWTGTMIKPEVVAPGAMICASRLDKIYSSGEHPYYRPCKDEEHVQFAGTSMATPHIAGSAALLLEAHPSWSPSQVKSALVNSAKDLDYKVWTQGTGRVDMLKANNTSLLFSPPTLNSFNFEKTNSNLTSELVISNTRASSLSLDLEVSNVSDLNGEEYNATSLNVTTPTISSEGSVPISLSVNTSKFGEDYFFGNINITAGSELYRVPFTFDTLAELTVEVYNASNEPAPFDFLAIYNETGYPVKSELAGYNVTTSLESGNYTVFANYNGVETHSLRPPFVLAEEIELQSPESQNLTLNASEANKVNVRGENPGGENLRLYDFEVGFGNAHSSYIVGSSGFAWVGNQTIYVSNFTDDESDYNVSINYQAVRSAGYCNQTIADCEYPGEEENINLAGKHYLLGWILDNATKDLSAGYNSSSLAAYNYTYNYPDFLPLREQSSFIDVTYFETPLSIISSAVGQDVSIPLNRTVFLNNLKFRYRSYIRDNNRGVDQENLKWNMQPQHFYFGRMPYQPAYFLNTNQSIGLRNFAVKGHGLNTWLDTPFSLQDPRIKIYNNSNLVYNKTDGNFWREFNHSFTNGNFLVNVTIPIGYPAWNFTLISSNFSLPGEDVNPPRLNRLKVKPRFQYGSPLEIRTNFTDDYSVENVSIYYKTSGNWKKTSVSNTSEIYNAFLTVTDPAVKEVNLKISAMDVHGNVVNYTVLPAAIPNRNLSIPIGLDPSKFIRGGNFSIKEKIRDNGSIFGARLKGFFNDTFLNEDMSDYDNSYYEMEKGEYEIQGEVPCNYTQGKANLSLIFEGANFYSNQENRTEVKVVPLNFSVNSTVPAEENVTINITAADGMLIINRTDLNWMWNTTINKDKIYFTPHNRGNYTIRLETLCGENVTQIIFANVGKKPEVMDRDFSTESDYFFTERNYSVEVVFNAKSYNSSSISITNSSWSKGLEVAEEIENKTDPVTGEPYNDTYCASDWCDNYPKLNASFSLANVGKYNITVNISNPAGIFTQREEELFFKSLNITFNLTNSSSHAVLRNVEFQLKGEGWLYGESYEVDGSENVTIPNITFSNESYRVRISEFEGEVYSIAAFSNLSINGRMNLTMEEIDLSGRYEDDSLLYGGQAIVDPHNYSGVEMKVIPSLNYLDNLKDENKSSLYACGEWSFENYECDSEWKNITKNKGMFGSGHQMLGGKKNESRRFAFVVGEPEYCGNGYCGSDESKESCSQDCGQPEEEGEGEITGGVTIAGPSITSDEIEELVEEGKAREAVEKLTNRSVVEIQEASSVLNEVSNTTLAKVFEKSVEVDRQGNFSQLILRMNSSKALEGLFLSEGGSAASLLESTTDQDKEKTAKLMDTGIERNLEKTASIADEMETEVVAKLLIQISKLPGTPAKAAKLLEKMSAEKGADVIEFLVNEKYFDELDQIFQQLALNPLVEIFKTVSSGTRNEMLDQLSQEVLGRIPRKFDYTDLKLSSVELNPGDLLEIFVSVENGGVIPQERDIKLWVNDTRKDTRSVSLESGESKNVTFTFRPSEPGNYQLEVGNLTSEFYVRERLPWMYLLLIPVVLIGGFLFLHFRPDKKLMEIQEKRERGKRRKGARRLTIEEIKRNPDRFLLEEVLIERARVKPLERRGIGWWHLISDQTGDIPGFSWEKIEGEGTVKGTVREAEGEYFIDF